MSVTGMFRPKLSRVPEDLFVDTDDDVDYFVEVPLAECTETDRLVSVDSRLEYTNNMHGRPGSAWFHELSFEFAVHYMDGSQPVWKTQDRQIVRNMLADPVRGLALDVVCASYAALVRRVRPLIIYRVTKLIAPPTKPLRKHERLTSTLEEEGYVVTETGTDPMGRRYWLMSKA